MTIRILRPNERFIQPGTRSSKVLNVCRTRSFKDSVQGGGTSTRKDLQGLVRANFRTFLFTRKRDTFVLNVRLLVFLVLAVIILSGQLRDRARQVAFVNSETSGRYRVRGKAFRPITLRLCRVKITGPRNGDHGSDHDGVVRKVTLAVIRATSSALGPSEGSFCQRLAAKRFNSSTCDLTSGAFYYWFKNFRDHTGRGL